MLEFPLQADAVDSERWQAWRDAVLAEVVRQGADEKKAARLLDTELREDFVELELMQQGLREFRYRFEVPEEHHPEIRACLHAYRRFVGEALYEFMLGFLVRRVRELGR